MKTHSKIIATCISIVLILSNHPSNASEPSGDSSLYTDYFSGDVVDEWRITPSLDDDSSSHQDRAAEIGPFVMKADNPHLSNGYVSAHGCYTGGPKGGLAKVRNWLERKNANGKWERVATGRTVTVPQGCGRGKRSNARAKCRSFNPTTYRNVVDVDIIGAVDSPAKAYRVNTVNCRV